MPMDTLAPQFSAACLANDNKIHILLAASGSVATIKLPNVAESLGRHKNVSIRIILTQSASRFLTGQSAEQPTLEMLRQINGVDGVYQDDDEWKVPWTRGAPILHIELRRWSDLMLIAPLSANEMAKMATGLADNLLLSVVRAWDTTGMVGFGSGKRRRIFVAPSMNTSMWTHRLTEKQLKTLRDCWGSGEDESWITVLMPMEKELACGDHGTGAMQDWREIVTTIENYIGLGE